MIIKGKDKEFIDNIISKLHQRFIININKTQGVLVFGGYSEDEIFPRVFVSKNEIKIMTNRNTLRDSVLLDYNNYINEKYKFINCTIKNDYFLNRPVGLIIEIIAVKKKNLTEFDSFNHMNESIKLELREYKDDLDKLKLDKDITSEDVEDFIVGNYPLRDIY